MTDKRQSEILPVFMTKASGKIRLVPRAPPFQMGASKEVDVLVPRATKGVMNITWIRHIQNKKKDAQAQGFSFLSSIFVINTR